MSFGLEKIPQKYPQQLCHFSMVRDDFNYEKKLINKKNLYWNVHHINIEV
jgi:hypothetical protein